MIRNPVTLAMVTDGTNNTAIFSEWIKGDGTDTLNSKDGLGMVYKNSGVQTQATRGNGNGEDLNSQQCQQRGLTREFSWEGERWLIQDPGRGGTYSHTMGPNRRSCWYDDQCCEGSDRFEHMMAGGSNHPGGVNVL